MTVSSAMVSAAMIASPFSIPGLQLWLDAADASTVTLTSSKVSQWNDKSGNGFNVSQSNASIRPTYGGTQNGKSVVTFSSAGFENTTSTLLRDVSGWSIFSVALCTAYTSNDSAVVYVIGLSNARAIVEIAKTTGYLTGGGRRVTANSIAKVSASAAVSTTNYGVFSVIGSYTTTTCTLYTNGVQSAQSTSWLSSGNSDNNAGGYTLGCGGFVSGVPDNPLSGSIAEVLIYNSALTNASRIAVEKYLRNKWGTT